MFYCLQVARDLVVAMGVVSPTTSVQLKIANPPGGVKTITKTAN